MHFDESYTSFKALEANAKRFQGVTVIVAGDDMLSEVMWIGMDFDMADRLEKIDIQMTFYDPKTYKDWTELKNWFMEQHEKMAGRWAMTKPNRF